MKNRTFITLALATLLSITATAQDHGRHDGFKNHEGRPSHEEMAKARSLEIASKIGLDEATAAKFSELYLQFLKDTGKMMREMHKPCTGKTDEEIDREIRDNFAFSRKMLDLREAYYEKFLKLLTPSQIQQMYRQEFEQGRRFGAGRPQHHGPQHHGPQGQQPQNR
ncbi:MAG: hypothetical protein KBS53_04895 [Bacteroidales bacterium]|nr:hypothetical protein [Candidatus Hennigimonas equi]